MGMTKTWRAWEKVRTQHAAHPAGPKSQALHRTETDSGAEWQVSAVVKSMSFRVSVLPALCVTLGELVDALPSLFSFK